MNKKGCYFRFSKEVVEMIDQGEEYFIFSSARRFKTYEDASDFRDKYFPGEPVMTLLSREKAEKLLLSRKKQNHALDVNTLERNVNDEGDQVNYEVEQVSSKLSHFRMVPWNEKLNPVEQNRVIVRFHSWPVAAILQLVHWIFRRH